MSNDIQTSLKNHPDNPELIQVTLAIHNHELLGKSASFQINLHTTTKRTNGLDDEILIWESDIQLTNLSMSFNIPRKELHAYSYTGKDIDVDIETKVIVNNALFFKTKVSAEQELLLGLKPQQIVHADKLMNPKDDYCFMYNLQSISVVRRAVVMILCMIGTLFVSANTMVGFHDQVAPIHQAYFYGGSEDASAMEESMTVSGIIVAVIFAAILFQLKKYMTFKVGRIPIEIKRGDSILVSDLFKGKSRVDLENVTLRVIACNLEHGKYLQQQGTNTVTVSIRTPVNGMILYTKDVKKIPKGVHVQSYFNDRVQLDDMFDTLYPMIGDKNFGVSVYWEIQLIHDRLVDQELELPAVFLFEEFLHVPESEEQTSDRIFDNVRPPSTT